MADESPIRGSRTITPHNTNTVSPGRLFRIKCTVAGDVVVRLRDGGTEEIGAEEGYSLFPYSVVGVNVTGTTATATYSNLY